jgi:hypothetical protein
MKIQKCALLSAFTVALVLTFWRTNNESAQAQSYNGPGATERTRVLLSKVETALDAFEVDCACFPTTTQGLSALFTNPGLPAWHGPYLDSGLVLTDGWGMPLHYEQDGTGLTLRSAGPDKIFQTTDDIVAIKKWKGDEKWH